MTFTYSERVVRVFFPKNETLYLHLLCILYIVFNLFGDDNTSDDIPLVSGPVLASSALRGSTAAPGSFGTDRDKRSVFPDATADMVDEFAAPKMTAKSEERYVVFNSSRRSSFMTVFLMTFLLNYFRLQFNYLLQYCCIFHPYILYQFRPQSFFIYLSFIRQMRVYVPRRLLC